MINERKKWMCYTYFNRDPGFRLRMAHLFSPSHKRIPGMIRVPCPTMVADITECDFLNSWSQSARSKIKKAENDGLTLLRDPELLPEILKLFSETARAKKLRGHHPEDFSSRPWILCSAIFLNDLMLAGHVWLIDEEEKKALLFVNASRHHDPGVDAALTGRAHYYLLWQDGMYMRSNGIDCMDLHGYKEAINDPKIAGVYKWKEATHGRKEELFHYYPFWFYWIKRMRKNISG